VKYTVLEDLVVVEMASVERVPASTVLPIRAVVVVVLPDQAQALILQVRVVLVS
jgi:hypothetical protein